MCRDKSYLTHQKKKIPSLNENNTKICVNFTGYNFVSFPSYFTCLKLIKQTKSTLSMLTLLLLVFPPISNNEDVFDPLLNLVNRSLSHQSRKTSRWNFCTRCFKAKQVFLDNSVLLLLPTVGKTFVTSDYYTHNYMLSLIIKDDKVKLIIIH